MALTFENKLSRYRESMPDPWRSRWDGGLLDEAQLIEFIRAVIEAKNKGELTYTQAGYVLQPIVGHPVSWAYLDGELVALGDFAGQLTEGTQLLGRAEEEYIWNELVGCLARIDLAQLSA